MISTRKKPHVHKQRTNQLFHQLLELDGIIRYLLLPRGNLRLKMPNFFVTEDVEKVVLQIL